MVFCIELIQMMENAGRVLAHLARERFLDGAPRGRGVVVLAGSGGNGGGALVCARRLHNCGAQEGELAVTPLRASGPSR
ncbi:MAG: NAD(P)H-hydrate epimerase [Anaerolineae bacterium]